MLQLAGVDTQGGIWRAQAEEDAAYQILHRPPMRAQVSTGDGKARVLDERETTVYKRALDQEYKLKLKASRSIFSEINKRYPTMPFTARACTVQGSGVFFLGF